MTDPTESVEPVPERGHHAEPWPAAAPTPGLDGALDPADAPAAGLDEAADPGAAPARGLDGAADTGTAPEHAPERPSELSGLDEALGRARRAASEMASAGAHEPASDAHIEALTHAHDQLRAVLDQVDGGR